jgi:hypothetical protein
MRPPLQMTGPPAWGSPAADLDRSIAPEWKAHMAQEEISGISPLLHRQARRRTNALRTPPRSTI